jgi:hypothetical protein
VAIENATQIAIAQQRLLAFEKIVFLIEFAHTHRLKQRVTLCLGESKTYALKKREFP